MFQIQRASVFVAGGALLVLAFAGCGGGGDGGISTPTSTPRATGTASPTATTSGTPAPTSVSQSCTAASYTPNYYGLRDPSSQDDAPDVYYYWRQFPVSVYIPTSASTASRNATIAGFNQWVTATGGKASYTLVNSATNANLVVSYSAQDPNSTTLGVTTVTYNASQRYIISAKMDLAFYTSAQLSDPNTTNQSIAAHEFGHALGVGPHSPYTADLMYPYLQRAQEDVTTRDLNTLRTIYCNTFPTTSTRALKNEGPTKTIVIRD